MKLTYRTYNLKFKYPFGISRGTKTHQPTFVVELEHLGKKGYGEAPAITYYHIPVEKMAEDLERKKIFVEKFAFTEPERWWHYLHHLFPAKNFLVCALDMAGWDLFGQMQNKPVSEISKKFEPVPQLLKNVRVSGGAPLEDKQVKQAIDEARDRLGKSGRLVIRPSGTEPLIRVMAEGDDQKLVETVVDDLVTVISQARNAA